jgi:hypothetical protein
MAIERRSGFALMLVIVSLAVAATLAGVAAPYLSSTGDTERANRTAAQMRKVAGAIGQFADSVTRIGANGTHQTPGDLTELSVPITNTSPSGCAASSQRFNNNGITKWGRAGPFGEYYIPSNGLWTPIGRLDNTPPARAAAANTYDVVIDNVDPDDAALLDITVDGVADAAADTVRYTVAGGVATVTWRVFFAYNAC